MPPPGGMMVINVEAGGFDGRSLPRLEEDCWLDSASPNPGAQVPREHARGFVCRPTRESNFPSAASDALLATNRARVLRGRHALDPHPSPLHPPPPLAGVREDDVGPVPGRARAPPGRAPGGAPRAAGPGAQRRRQRAARLAPARVRAADDATGRAPARRRVARPCVRGGRAGRRAGRATELPAAGRAPGGGCCAGLSLRVACV